MNTRRIYNASHATAFDINIKIVKVNGILCQISYKTTKPVFGQKWKIVVLVCFSSHSGSTFTIHLSLQGQPNLSLILSIPFRECKTKQSVTI